MKTTLQTTTVAVFVAALGLGTCTMRADDDTKTVRRHHEATQKSHVPVSTKDDRNAKEVQGDVVGGANGPEHRVLTGSHLPEHYNRRGYSTDSRNNESIYDHNDIRLQNSNTVGDALRQVPGVNVGGSR